MQLKVAYIVGCYPFINITFIHREIVAIRRQGVELEIVSMLRPEEGYLLEEARDEMSQVLYVQPLNWLEFVWANMFFLLTQPHIYVQLLVHFATRPHNTVMQRLKTIGHVAMGVLVAWKLREKKLHHVHGHFADRATVVAHVSAKLLGIHHSFTAHAKDIYAENVFLNDKIKDASFMSTCTGFNRDYLTDLADQPHKVHLLYHGLDFSDFTNLARQPLDPPLILAIGKLNEKKGFPYLIDACAELHKQGYRFQCWIIGEGADRDDLTDQITRHQLDDIVQLKGNMPFRQVLNAFSQATLFALPCVVAANNDRDGIPNVILEAMAAGVPVISTPISAIPEAVHHNETGYLVESRNEQQLTDGLKYLLDSPVERERLAQTARHFVEKNFEVNNNVLGLKLLFEQHLHPQVRAAMQQSSAQVGVTS
ncbi:MAG: glycosyltransferase family 4 protein [Anaerolineae bacterium]|nr:glycosyltransferase family 4 protein [Anaerolineae bacterium]